MYKRVREKEEEREREKIKNVFNSFSHVNLLRLNKNIKNI